MSKRFYLFVLTVFSMYFVMGQSPLDGFKYIIIPKKFDFLEQENQYRVNSTTKYLFEQQGFQTLLQGEDYPDDLIKNPCLAATADVTDESGLLTTKLYVLLRDCHDQEVYRSEMGKSKEKSYDKTYIDALNDAFVSIGALSYQYRPELAEAAVTPVAPVTASAAIVSSDTGQKVSEAEAAEAAVEKETVEASPGVSPGANSYGNDKVSFLLVAQGDDLVAYVTDSKNGAFQKGEVIGTLSKTSLPKVYRASWKNMDKSIEQTTAYFDEQGNLRIDVQKDGKIEVLTFIKE